MMVILQSEVLLMNIQFYVNTTVRWTQDCRSVKLPVDRDISRFERRAYL